MLNDTITTFFRRFIGHGCDECLGEDDKFEHLRDLLVTILDTAAKNGVVTHGEILSLIAVEYMPNEWTDESVRY